MDGIVQRRIVDGNEYPSSSHQFVPCLFYGRVRLALNMTVHHAPLGPPAGVPRAGSSTSPYESGRRFGIRDGMFYAVAQGAGEQYLSAFALLLHATPFQLSILSAIPQLLGTWAQLVSVKVSHWFANRASHVFWGIIGQSVSWIPILALPLFWPDQGPWLLITAVSVYFIFTHFTAPVWNSLITDLLEPDERGMYFANEHERLH
ncbi:MAG: hypothetical protein QM706_04010 [Nitrospira sp.]